MRCVDADMCIDGDCGTVVVDAHVYDIGIDAVVVDDVRASVGGGVVVACVDVVVIVVVVSHRMSKMNDLVRN